MYLSSMTISGFRQFGSGEKALTIPFNKGITALVGRNDSGKTAVIDAIRFALLTRDHDSLRLQEEDFHINNDKTQERTICIQCKFSELSNADKGTFLEHLTYENGEVSLYVTYTATKTQAEVSRRRWFDISIRSGKDSNGPLLETATREILAAAYLKPLRDAEREMSAGRNSRLSQILANLENVNQGTAFDENTLPELNHDTISKLGIVGLADFFAHYIKNHPGVGEAKDKINNNYLKELSMVNAFLQGDIQFISPSSEDIRLRQVLERLELQGASCNGSLGLGSNNLLFIGCELLLLGNEKEGAPLLLIEEPEAHLHPQRQLRLMEFLKKTAQGSEETGQPVQVILSTHSPNLASRLPLESLVLLTGKQAYSLASPYTKLSKNDYRFLERFLDVTKANLFFADGVIIVEGDAEAILLPTIARLMGKDLTAHGVSIVNVGSTALSRFSKIFQRTKEDAPHIPIPIACITDRDIMPDCAPQILGLVKDDDSSEWENSRRKWRCEKELDESKILKRLNNKKRYDGQNVKTFISDKWSFEYDLAFYGLKQEVHRAITFALYDEKLQEDTKKCAAINRIASHLILQNGTKSEVCSHIYKPLYTKKASKAVSAQYLCNFLEKTVQKDKLTEVDFEKLLPKYIVDAIKFVTEKAVEKSHG